MMKSNTSGNSPTDSGMFARQLSTCQVVEKSFHILFDNLCTFLSLGLLFFLVLIVPMVVIIVTMGDTTTTSSSSSSSYSYSYSASISSTNQDQQLSSGAAVAVCIFLLMASPVIMLFVAATIRATAEVYAGEKPQIGAVLKVGFRNICRLFCFGFVLLLPLAGLALLGIVFSAIVMSQQSDSGSLSGVGIILACVLLVAWFTIYIFVMIPFQMAPPSLVLERTSVCGVVSRVWELANGSQLKIFTAIMMLAGINFVIGIIPLVGLFWHVVAMPLSSILATVLFIRLRIENEGLNCSALRGELGLDLTDETEMVKGEYEDEKPMPYSVEKAEIV